MVDEVPRLRMASRAAAVVPASYGVREDLVTRPPELREVAGKSACDQRIVQLIFQELEYREVQYRMLSRTAGRRRSGIASRTRIVGSASRWRGWNLD